MLDENTGSILLLRGFLFFGSGSGNNNDVGWKYNKFHKTTYYFWWGEGPTNIFSLSLLLMLVVDEQTKRGTISLTLQLSLVS